ncbi:MAG TPA: hypothetical protein VI759_10995 [Dehalococcoidia bacterium]|nr:hypothetical protein [Dehalococcoidia bacterium]
MLNAITRNLQYVRGLYGFLRHPLSDAEVYANLERELANREATFLSIVRDAVYAHAASPYARLLAHAGIEYEDVAGLVRDHGLEGALERLADAGVYITLQQLKGREPIVRPGLELKVSTSDFNNPLVKSVFESSTSGSRGPSTRLPRNFAWLEDECSAQFLQYAALKARGRPIGYWRPSMPEPSAISSALMGAKLNRRVDVWFTPTPFSFKSHGSGGMTRALTTMAVFRSMGRKLPWPHYVPYDDPMPVVRWLAAMRARGTPAVIHTIVSPAVRVCTAAMEAGLDISGSTFRIGGEPLTPMRAKIIADAGVGTGPTYAMSEVGNIAYGCANRSAVDVDDMHVFTGKVAVTLRPVAVRGGATVRALALTTLLRSSPTVLLNAESGDSGDIVVRECGCPMGALGLNTHITNLRSYDKLTSEGVTYLGSELHMLLEEVLPRRFGGSPVDYQLVEEDVAGLPKISLVVSPRVGAVDEAALLAVVSEWLSKLPSGGKEMAGLWNQTGVLNVQRREPYATRSAKVLTLHVVQPDTSKAEK